MTLKIQRSFSKAARQYDLLTSLQRSIADELFKRVAQSPEPRSMLDVGCGTGYLTNRLKAHWPQARVVGLDFAQGMLDVARAAGSPVEWVLGDGNHAPFHDSEFELIVSNLAYQWADGLTESFKEANRLLAANGVLAGTLFGFNTAHELFQSLHEAKGEALSFTRMPGLNQVRDALTCSGLRDIHVDAVSETHCFKNMYELIKWFKDIGANNLTHQGFVGPEALAGADEIYAKRFKFENGVAATFEVIRFEARK